MKRSRLSGIFRLCIFTQCPLPSKATANHILVSGDANIAYALTASVTGGTPLIHTTGGVPFIAYEDFSAIPIPCALLLIISGALGLVAILVRATERALDWRATSNQQLLHYSLIHL